MQLPLLGKEDERLLIEATLEFANMKEIETAREVEEIFRRLPIQRKIWKSIPDSDVQAFKNDQEELKEWLDMIIEEGVVNKRVGELISKRIGTVRAETKTVYDQKTGSIDLNTELYFEGVQACYGYAIALLLDRKLMLRDKIKKCLHMKCKKYFFNANAGKGRPKEYCCTKHASADRQKRYRSKMG